jgi:hypothetical protein
MDRIWIGYGLDTVLSDYIISISYPISNHIHVILGYPWILLYDRGHGTRHGWLPSDSQLLSDSQGHICIKLSLFRENIYSTKYYAVSYTCYMIVGLLS